MSTTEGEPLHCTITDQGDGIRCFGKTDEGEAVFVEGKTVPGDQVLAAVTTRHHKYLVAKLLEITEPSSDRIPAPCPHFETCGGCKWQQLPYELEGRLKHKQVADAIQHIGHLEGVEVLPLVPADDLYGYRNKLSFSCRDHALGYHLPGDGEAVMPISHCALGTDATNRVLEVFRDHTSLFHRLTLRQASVDQRILIQVDSDLPASGIRLPDFAEVLPPPAYSLRWNDEVVYGEPNLEETLDGHAFTLSPDTFFQVNQRQAEKLLKVIIDFANLKADEDVWECYSGVGAFSLSLARRCQRLTGFEYSEEAVRLARVNAKANRIDNTRFAARDLDAVRLDRMEKDAGYRPKVMIVDPPRTGLTNHLVNIIAKLQPQRMVYVSCKPATFARDAERLAEIAGLKCMQIQPVDLFPRTGHVECVGRFVRKEEPPVHVKSA
ncbi:MAG: 23S rRNA (uracil1939-C5)-methyltransferase [Kiritimatiellia bacterium]|jgi:23S rRNA (uracil1939-C5)-methyltransferase